MRILLLSFLAALVTASAAAEAGAAFQFRARDASVRPLLGGGNLYLNGKVGEFVHVTQEGPHRFTVRARGSQAKDEWPVMALGVDGMERTRINVDSGEFQDYTITLELTPGTHFVSAALRNYSIGLLENRNLYLDTFTLTPAEGGTPPVRGTADAWTADAQAREQAALARAAAEMPRHRMSDLTIEVRDKDGAPVPDAEIEVEQLRHAFLFGANIAAWDQFPSAEQNAAYAQRFADLFNFATLTLYWMLLEPADGARLHDLADRTAAWARERDITLKGHPLLWADPASLPKWLDGLPSEARQRAHLEDLVKRFRGTIGYWDVVNEPANAPGIALGPPHAWTRALDPDAVLIVNEYGILSTGHEAFHALLETAIADGVPFDAIGIQAHAPEDMAFHLGRVWEVLDHYAALGKDLHITEFTPPGDGRAVTGTIWRGAWTPETQAEYAEKFYRLCFAHPAVKAISWWDVADANAWIPGGGLLDRQLRPKPAYEALYRLIREEWWTRESGAANAEGRFTLRAFHGEHRAAARHDGRSAETRLHLRPGENPSVTLVLE